MKNVVSYILIFSILLSGFIYVKPTETQAKTTADNFDLSKYRADEYLKKGSVCNNIIKNLLKDETLSSQVIVRDLNSKGFKASVAAWETAHLLEKSPYEIAQGEIDKKDIMRQYCSVYLYQNPSWIILCGIWGKQFRLKQIKYCLQQIAG